MLFHEPCDLGRWGLLFTFQNFFLNMYMKNQRMIICNLQKITTGHFTTFLFTSSCHYYIFCDFFQMTIWVAIWQILSQTIPVHLLLRLIQGKQYNSHLILLCQLFEIIKVVYFLCIYNRKYSKLTFSNDSQLMGNRFMANLHASLKSTCKSRISKIATRCQNWGGSIISHYVQAKSELKLLGEIMVRWGEGVNHLSTFDADLRNESFALISFMGFPAILST